MEEGPPVWREVKYGKLQDLKTLLRMATSEQASFPGGPHLTSPLHEAIRNSDVNKVNALRKAGVSLDYKPPSGQLNGLTPLVYAKMISYRSDDADTIARNLAQDKQHGDVYALQHAEWGRLLENRRLALEEARRPGRDLAFSMISHERLGAGTVDIPNDILDTIRRFLIPVARR